MIAPCTPTFNDAPQFETYYYEDSADESIPDEDITDRSFGNLSKLSNIKMDSKNNSLLITEGQEIALNPILKGKIVKDMRSF